MKLLWIAALPTVLAAFGPNFLYDKANQGTPTRLLARQLHVRRSLEACDFFTTLGLNCSLDELCRLFNEGDEDSTYECGGDVQGEGEFYYKVIDPLTCYENFQAEGGASVDDSAADILPAGYAYCSRTTGLFNFTGDLLTLTDISEEITTPETLKGVVRLVMPVSACTEDEQDFFVNQPYCIGSCPTLMEISGVQCEDACLECDDGSTLPNCGNVDESLVGNCNAVEWDDDDLTEEFLGYFNKTNVAPASSSARQVYGSLLCGSAVLFLLALY